MTTTATPGHDAEELLQRILYSDLARLVDPPAALLLRRESSGDDDHAAAVPEMIWQYLCCSDEPEMDEEVAALEEQQQQQLVEEEEEDEWKRGWKQIGAILSSNALSPFCIHDTATQALFLKESGDLDEENKGLQSIHDKKAGASSSSSSCFFTMTCFLVCCAALQHCPSPSQPTVTNNTPPLSRKRRWRSCMMNTVRLVQQQWLQQQHQQNYATTNNDDVADGKYSKIMMTVSIFVHFIVPTCLQVQQALFHDDIMMIQQQQPSQSRKINSNDAWFWQAAIHAGLVATISSMATTAAAITTNSLTLDDNDKGRLKLLACLVHTLERVLTTEDGDGDVHAVWKHPWRKRRRLGPQVLLRADESISMRYKNSHTHKAGSTIPALSYEDSLCYWTAPMLSDDDDDDDWGGSDFDDDDDEPPKSRVYRRSESVVRISTIWNNVGIAVLAQYNLTVDEHRPRVYTNRYVWLLGFPHVSTLLLTEAMINDNDNAKDVQYSRYRCCQQVKQQMLGYTLLEWLLSRLPEQELTKPTCIRTTVQEPLSPIPVFQLLANRIVDTGSRAAIATTATSTTTTTAALPSGYQAYQLMKLLLSKYKLAHQLDLVRTLYTECPHPGLGPKILDLLRGLLLSLATSKTSAAATGEVDGPDDVPIATLRLALWGYLDNLLRDLDGHVTCLITETMAMETSPEDDKSSASQSLFLIDSVQEFVADAEKFVSVFTLIRTWMLLVKNNNHNDDNSTASIPDIPQLATRLDAAHQALETMFEHEAENDSILDTDNSSTMAATTTERPPEQQLFRLQLLMQALEECIQLLSSESTGS
jgi:hypothetical protein